MMGVTVDDGFSEPMMNVIHVAVHFADPLLVISVHYSVVGSYTNRGCSSIPLLLLVKRMIDDCDC